MYVGHSTGSANEGYASVSDSVARHSLFTRYKNINPKQNELFPSIIQDPMGTDELEKLPNDQKDLVIRLQNMVNKAVAKIEKRH